MLENNGYFQNRLWKSLNIDNRKCSRKVKSLVDKEIILRQPAVNNGSRTYKLYIRI
ncbi:hypothetical protein [Methanohalophilus mahii]|uniref:hypothetical protein n=1 Tax=Methanohalophilus mahii TaxID=2176 RepID=UPI00373AEE48